MNRETGKFIEVLRDRNDDDEDSAKEREAVESSPDSWLEIPIPDHGQHHKWLRAFLRSIDREQEYSGSIGGWLKEYGSTTKPPGTPFDLSGLSTMSSPRASALGLTLRLCKSRTNGDTAHRTFSHGTALTTVRPCGAPQST